MGEPDEEGSEARCPVTPPGWRVLTTPEREPDPAGDELRDLLRGIDGRRQALTVPEETDDPPEAA